MTDSQQQQMIQDAMKAIAERKPGRTKLVYDKTKRTIVAVAAGADAPRALNITADDADMFAVVTVSSAWLRDQWGLLGSERMVPTRFSSWDDGDAYTHCELGALPAATIVEGMILRGDGKPPAEAARLKVVLADGKGLGQFLESGILKNVARIGGGLGEDGEGKVAVFSRDIRVHRLLSFERLGRAGELSGRRGAVRIVKVAG